MSISNKYKQKINQLKLEYEQLKQGKESLLDIIFEAELPEGVYNSNAIENSTLTIAETERILLELDLAREVSLREVFEAKNLARVSEYIRKRALEKKIDQEVILLLHKMLLMNINEDIAGRWRLAGEYVRVGTHIAAAPEKIEGLIQKSLVDYESKPDDYFLDKITRFHLEFESTHPFVDGNGRIGRAIINYQLFHLGFPPIIVRNKGKQKYYDGFKMFDQKSETKPMEDILLLALLESFHKRLAYLRGDKIVLLSEHAKRQKRSINTLLNAARRQTIPAFREKGVWKISNE
ncbi:MAG: Fic family protein [Candidatus Uhrbacteria bacterium]